MQIVLALTLLSLLLTGCADNPATPSTDGHNVGPVQGATAPAGPAAGAATLGSAGTTR